jgi:CheY-like chemotaxis protein
MNDKAARFVTIAYNNCERLIRLINDILDIEKIESGKMAFDLREMTLPPLIKRTVDANRQFAADHQVTLETHLPFHPQIVRGDPDRLEQLFTNLVSNAIKHSPPESFVEISSRELGDKLRIEVRDRGAGVPSAFRERIFQKFAMADSSDSRTRGGTGLGLSIAREIAERHGGLVDFHDREGGGTVFFVELPLVVVQEGESDSESKGLPLILHVDDDYDCLSVVAGAFAGKAAVVRAESLEEARNAAAWRPIDGIIIDVDLGSANGLDLIPELRAQFPGVPIVLFTAVDGDYEEINADRVLIKSRASLEELVEVMLKAVRSAGRKAA